MTDSSEARNEFWSMEGNDIYRHHVEPRVQLHVPKEESFPRPLRYIDVVWTTHTTLDMVQESRKDNSWNIDGESKPIGTVDPFHAVHGTVLNEKPPDRYMWSRERLAKFSQPQGLIIRGQEFRPECQKAAQRKEKQQKAIEIPKLDNPRKSRGMYFIDPDDQQFKEIFFFKKKMELPMEAAIS